MQGHIKTGMQQEAALKFEEGLKDASSIIISKHQQTAK